jgi:CheY-like chemotaxis protein
MKKLSKELPLSILIAEDNYINQKLLLDVLATQGYKCDAVSNGYEVIETVQKKKYDLILMDIQMPGMSGEETMKQVREMKQEESPKIIAVTAYAMADDRDKLIEGGMDGYISKPFRVEELISEIRKVVKKS